MGEAEFWMNLEYRLCREFEGMADRGLRHLWCDGFIPQQYHLGDTEPRITGREWICTGQLQEEWAFTLFLPQSVGSREEVDWVSLLPPENVTRWLALDRHEELIQIEPGAAVPDPG